LEITLDAHALGRAPIGDGIAAAQTAETIGVRGAGACWVGAAGVLARTVPGSCISAEAAHIVVDGGAPGAAEKNGKQEEAEGSLHNDLLVLFVAILLVSPAPERLHPLAKIHD
jgi:hypothetical protein